jgi:hypothetical protein
MPVYLSKNWSDTNLLRQMKKWKKWEAETATLEYQFANGQSLPLSSYIFFSILIEI